MTGQHLCIGLVAHVDAGKTTLAEAMLYTSGSIRTLGRVDNQDAYLDNYDLERQRGITIFSKQATLPLPSKQVTLLDTPGHVDFSAEMERALQVLDAAVLIISGPEGVQSHTRTLWKLLRHYQVPTILFVNKMDQEVADEGKIIEELNRTLSDQIVRFGPELEDEELEKIALADEKVMDIFLDTGKVADESIRSLIMERKLFPCFFGSALKLQGIDELIYGLERYLEAPVYKDAFAAKVYKIGRDENGNRLTYMKITGGSLKVKEEIDGEKVDQIRIYSGKKYVAVPELFPGQIGCVLGLNNTKNGQCLGDGEEGNMAPVLEPVLTYQVILPKDCDPNRMLRNLAQIEEEEPQLHVIWNEKLREIQVQMMGDVQTDVLKNMVKERFDIDISFGPGSIVYKETIANTVEGVGHFEPLRHFAEVHILMEPLEFGSGMEYDTDLREDVLERNWQRLILTNMEEKTHKGVLIGADLTDVKLTVIGGKAHQKHTEGGDFRQATYRAIRQGLMQAKSVLLEPYYEFYLYLPPEYVGRAMTDIDARKGTCKGPEPVGDEMLLTGIVPVATFRGYQMEVLAYTRGLGKLICTMYGYGPCHNTEEVLAQSDYNPENDLRNPSSSVFCAHGAGFMVPWNEIYPYLSVPMRENHGNMSENQEKKDYAIGQKVTIIEKESVGITEEEIREIFARTYGGSGRKKKTVAKRRVAAPDKTYGYRPVKNDSREKYLLVDGYNVMFADEDMKQLATENMDASRDKLLEELSNYQGFIKSHLIVVFDAYKVRGFQGEKTRYHNIDVVFTKEAETADRYIERFAHEHGKHWDITVATSDGMEQVIILGQGCKRLSSRELLKDMHTKREIGRETMSELADKSRRYLFDDVSEETIQRLTQPTPCSMDSD